MRRFYGIPHPGTFVLDRSGRVTARFFEEGSPGALHRVEHRGPASAKRFPAPPTGPQAVSPPTTSRPSRGPPTTSWRRATACPSWSTVALKPGMHVYAPGDHGYRVIRLRLTAPDFLRSREVDLPAFGVVSLSCRSTRRWPSTRSRFRLVSGCHDPDAWRHRRTGPRSPAPPCRSRGLLGVSGVRSRDLLSAGGGSAELGACLAPAGAELEIAMRGVPAGSTAVG